MSGNAIEIRGLVKTYGGSKGQPEKQALRGIDLDVPAGSVFGLLGPNGAGKSTLINILAGLVIKTAGRVTIDGRVASLLEVGTGFHPELTGRENMVHGGRLYGLTGAALSSRVDEMLGRYKLTDRADERCAALSGGLRRRVELAKSLLHKPKVVLLDEPSTGLDPAARRDLWDHLRALKAEGATILTTTHLMDEGDLCDRVAILDQGKVVASGSPASLKAEIGGEVITVETENAAALAAEIESKFKTAPRVFEGSLRIELEAAHAFIPKLVEAFPGRLRTVSLSKPSLEDAFLHHAGRRFSDAEAAP